MQYLLLIYHDEKRAAGLSTEDRNTIYAEYRQLMGELTTKGKLKAGDELQPTRTATTVRMRGGKRLLTDGPFAETKEQLGGYFLIEARDLDEALAIAAKVPIPSR